MGEILTPGDLVRLSADLKFDTLDETTGAVTGRFTEPAGTVAHVIEQDAMDTTAVLLDLDCAGQWYVPAEYLERVPADTPLSYHEHPTWTPA